MSKPVYRWTLELGVDSRDASPIYEQAVSIVKEQEQGEVFFRSKISGALNFVRADYTFIMGAGMEDEIRVILEEFTGTWDLVFYGYFHLTDCEIDEDNHRVTVTPTPLDEYESVVNALDREFDLVQLEAATTPLEFQKNPVFQFYILGIERLTNVVGATYWDQDVLAPVYSPIEMQNTYFFGSPAQLVFVPGDDTVLDPDVSGLYNFIDLGGWYGIQHTRTDGAYKIRLRPSVSAPSFQWEIVDAGGTPVYEKALNEELSMPNQLEPSTALFSSLSSGSKCSAFSLGIYCRVLTNNDTEGGSSNHAVPTLDIIAPNANYTRVISVDLNEDAIILSSGHQVLPSIFGRFSDTACNFANEYFLKPVPSPAVGSIFPLFRHLWKEFSAWFYYDAALLALQEAAGEAITLTDCYKLPDILSAILAQIDPLVLHEETDAYSDFYYGMENPIRGDVKAPMFTPKSNVTVGNYDYPAAKAPLKLSELLSFLKQAHDVYWYIEDGKFKLEHIAYFENGKSYAAAGIGVDLTTLLEPKTALPWGYRANRYKFEKADMPEAIRWSWMDPCSVPFAGYPLEMRSAYVKKGSFEDLAMALFSADIDFVLAQTESISPDGFMFFEATPGDGYTLPFVTFTVADDEVYTMQNGYASLLFMVDAYHRERLPASLIRLNKQDDTANSVRRSKIQEIEFPSGVDPDAMLLVVTGLGTGKVRAMTINLSSRSNKMTLLYDLE